MTIESNVTKEKINYYTSIGFWDDWTLTEIEVDIQ
jgi:hypothetical protein